MCGSYRTLIGNLTPEIVPPLSGCNDYSHQLLASTMTTLLQQQARGHQQWKQTAAIGPEGLRSQLSEQCHGRAWGVEV